MPTEQDWSKFNLGSPAIYLIKIRGYLDDNWSNQLGGMAIRHVTATKDVPLTILEGKMVDQAALFGVLNGLYGLGFPILFVECLPDIQESTG